MVLQNYQEQIKTLQTAFKKDVREYNCSYLPLQEQKLEMSYLVSSLVDNPMLLLLALEASAISELQLLFTFYLRASGPQITKTCTILKKQINVRQVDERTAYATKGYFAHSHINGLLFGPRRIKENYRSLTATMKVIMKHF